MERQVLWAPWDGPGLQHLSLVQQDEGILADGVVIGLDHDAPFRAQYTIRCDAQWRLRELNLDLLQSEHPDLQLRTNGRGQWTDGSGEPLPALDGCLDVELSVTPFTHTLPIRRLKLQPGQARDLSVVYLAIPDLQPKPVSQRYTCLDLAASGGQYRYEASFRGFTAELPVDGDGLVLDYPETFRRIWPR